MIISEKILALKEMNKIAGKYFPELLGLIRKEIEIERSNIQRDNLLKLRTKCINKK